MELASIENQTARGRGLGAFTLIELLVVMAVIAVLATMAIPAMKGFGNGNALSSANRQLLQDIEFARLRAMNERTTVYMVFVPPSLGGAQKSAWTASQTNQAYRLLPGQYSSYALFARRSLGDQPGAGTLRYLTEWRSLPEGVIIATNKFMFGTLVGSGMDMAKWGKDTSPERSFLYMSLPFPTAESGTNAMLGAFGFPAGVPVLAFNHLGQLVQEGTPRDEYIQLTRAAVTLGKDDLPPHNNTWGQPEVTETPAKNSTNNPQIRIDWLTGRARSELRSL